MSNGPQHEIIDKIVSITEQKLTIWNDVFGYAPISAAIKLDKAMFSWMKSLTYTLRMWLQQATLGDLDMSEGELILAYANLGALVESWLKFFLSVYYLDYRQNPCIKRGKTIEPEDLELEDLKQYCRGILWTETAQDSMFQWVEKVQHRRNAIHSYKYRNIGTATEFLEDVTQYYFFLQTILTHLPDDPHWDV